MPKARILIVEDELITAEGIKILLKNANYEPVGVITSGEEALSKITQIKPDIILMDIVLNSKIDGIETATLIKELYGTPVVFLTAYGDIKTLERAKLAEPYGYIMKPINFANDLLPVLEITLHNHKIKLERNRKYEIMEDIIRNKSTTEENITNDTQINRKQIKIDFNEPHIDQWLNALGNIDRLVILNHLIDGSKKFDDFFKLLGKAKSTVFRHLNILEENNLIVGYKEGKSTIYSISKLPQTIEFFNSGNLSKWTRIFKALGNKDRISIISELLRKTLSTSELAKKIKIDQLIFKRNLRTLQQAGLVKFQKKGKEIILILQVEVLNKIINFFYDTVKVGNT
jgi:CheY-like chemotaxis protein